MARHEQINSQETNGAKTVAPNAEGFTLVQEVAIDLVDAPSGGSADSDNNKHLDLEPDSNQQMLLPEAHFQLFMRQARRYPRLSAEQEVALGRQVQAGLQAKERLKVDKTSVEARAADEALARAESEAKHKLLLANLRLAGKQALSIYFKNPVAHAYGLMDLCQEGLIGLHKSIEKFDPESGKPFALHAVPYIKGNIYRALENQGNAIRLPVWMHDSLRRLRKMEQAGASDQEILAELGISQTTLDSRRVIRPLGEPPVSLDKVVFSPPDKHGEQELSKVEDPSAEDAYDPDYDSPLLRELKSLLSFSELGIMTKIMQGKELSDVEIRQKIRLDSLFEHPAVWARLRRLYPEAQTGSDWRDAAACIGYAEIFSHPHTYRKQKVIPICGGCAVRAQCRQHLVERRPEKGRWAGGYTRDNLTKMKRRRQSGISRH